MVSFCGLWFLKWVLPLVVSFAPTADDTSHMGIQFYDGTLQEARDQAMADDKLIFIEVYADWCTPCKVMEESTFRDAQVVDLIENHFLAWKVDVESTPGKLFAIQEGIHSLPALLVQDAQGNPLMKINKALQPQAFIQMLKAHL